MEAKTNKDAKKESTTKRVLNFVKEDHPFENWVLFVLSIVLLVLAIYILLSAASDKNTFADTYFNVSNSGWAIFNKPWKVILISSIIIAIAAGALIYSVYPVFVPTFKELKNV